MPNVIKIAWSNGFSIESQPSNMLGGAILTVEPPTINCTINFSPAIAKVGSSTPASSYPLVPATIDNFTMPSVPSGEHSYTFNFSVPGQNGGSGANGRSIPVSKTGGV